MGMPVPAAVQLTLHTENASYYTFVMQSIGSNIVAWVHQYSSMIIVCKEFGFDS